MERIVGISAMEGVTGVNLPDDHSFRWVFGGSNHPDREDDETQRKL
jgi:hypothetical protein